MFYSEQEISDVYIYIFTEPNEHKCIQPMIELSFHRSVISLHVSNKLHPPSGEGGGCG